MKDLNVKNCFLPADILLPDFDKVDGKKWSVIACDQFTSEKDYWDAAEQIIGDSESTMNLMIPEIYLEQSEDRIPLVHAKMEEYLKSVLISHPESMIYLERVQSDGRLRRGIVGMVDLEKYDYTKGSQSLIRATEGTVLSRIPPRVAVRREAPIELPHVILLVDDPERTVVEPLSFKKDAFGKAYDFELMLGSGSVKAFFIDKESQKEIANALEKLVSPDKIAEKYGSTDIAPLLFAVGDGNHSLATAKAAYEEVKSKIGEEKAKNSLARYALAEVENLHDDTLEFEPIYRILLGADENALTDAFEKYIETLKGDAPEQKIILVGKDGDKEFCVPAPVQQLAVGTLQEFLDKYLEAHPEIEIDYIHGEDSLRSLSEGDGVIGFLFDGMQKDELFKTVIFDGSLPRKTFSMGLAKDKRFYIECRKIK